MAKTKTTQIAIRVPDSWLARLDRRAAAMRKLSPGLRITRSDAIRTLLGGALDATEKG